MKQFRFLAITLVTSTCFFLSSCGSGDNEKKADDKTADSSQAKTAEIKPPPPAPAKPAEMMVIQQKVANYAKWKPMYDSHDSVRKANGLSSYVVARGIQDSNTVLVAMRMTDIDKARAMGESQELKDRMKKAGVIGKPSISYMVEVMQDTTNLPQAARVRVSHKVKDWDAWKKEFDDHKQARIDAGLIDRVVGHEIGDDHMVTLVFAITDMAKAKAFMNSKDLKDKMEKAGVVGPPSFFFYNIVQKY